MRLNRACQPLIGQAYTAKCPICDGVGDDRRRRHSGSGISGFANRVGEKRPPARLFVDQPFQLDLDAFARRTAVTGAGGQQRLGFLRRRGLDAPLLDAGDHHPGVKQPRLGLLPGRRLGPRLGPGLGPGLGRGLSFQCATGQHCFLSRIGRIMRSSRPAFGKNKEETAGNDAAVSSLVERPFPDIVESGFPKRPEE